MHMNADISSGSPVYVSMRASLGLPLLVGLLSLQPCQRVARGRSFSHGDQNNSADVYVQSRCRLLAACLSIQKRRPHTEKQCLPLSSFFFFVLALHSGKTTAAAPHCFFVCSATLRITFLSSSPLPSSLASLPLHPPLLLP